MPVQLPDNLPQSTQLVLAVIFGMTTLLAMGIGYFTTLFGKKQPPAATPNPNPDIVLTAAGLVDMKPIRDLVGVVSRHADAQEAANEMLDKQVRCLCELKAMFAEHMKELEIQREVEERMGRRQRPRS